MMYYSYERRMRCDLYSLAFIMNRNREKIYIPSSTVPYFRVDNKS
jgi:hypothetical protein